MIYRIQFSAVLFFIYFNCYSQSKYVNPFIGAVTSGEKAETGGHGFGKTFPGAATPFGLTQVSPNTITGGDNGSGYNYEHTSIEGFAFTQMSGIGWYGDLGNFLVMPTTGELKTSAGSAEHPEKGYRSRFSKKDEKAGAGYYGVLLSDYNIKAEMTATPHSGMLRFTFPKHKKSRIQIDLARRVGGTSTEQYVKVVDNHTIQGWMKCTPEGGGWGNGDGKANYTVYFYAQFSKPFTDTGVWSCALPKGQKRKLEDVTSASYQEMVSRSVVTKNIGIMEGKHLGFYTEFPTQANEQVLMKAGISFVSMEGAKNNLETEIKDWNFNNVLEQTQKRWDDALGKIEVQGGTEDEKTVFYTALYHSMIDPRDFSDVDGKYVGGDGHIHQTKDFTKRTVFSGWDVFRSQFPLQTIINPTIANDMINSLVTLAEESKQDYLERWEFLNAYSGCMIGNPAVSVITDAYMKGISNFDVEKAYKYARQTVEKFGNGEKGTTGEISTTLEYAYTEWCLSQLAKRLNKTTDVDLYAHRAQSYRNLFDPTVGWFRPKEQDGTWSQWPETGRLTQNYGCVESNPYQQGWFVPHDVDGLAGLLGGKQKTIADLNSFFELAPQDMMWNNYYNHANEPVHHAPFLFNRLGAPWLTQKWTREICSRAYHNSVYGLIGNEDVGQMSAWYVLAASGLHPICPGDTRYEITSPVFDTITFKLDPKYYPGTQFVIKTENNSPENRYIQKAELNGVSYNNCFIDHNEIMRGGTLVLFMGNEPNKQWGLGKTVESK
ncbi:GH92 family glycosyl hydrolase [uncultured Sphingobacterium sp.]|uniref:GH92 family glycosyl hydrolase n=1 Tax=uncultured Sphingobacterium sp. TaxID=182688 RepID=UPI00374A75A9